ncbi:PLAT/LH2 domain-containing protein [Kitasatospora sp. NPDC096077]|uniref:PLAT/LH2 domain-containing protein n=1 Tax=Kitasatospora sp. NPDC096077 TaxID=3155544 RepID=UPI003325BC81
MSKIEYEVTTYTGDRDLAGTDANVYIYIRGTDGSTDQIFLDNDENNFERGKVDFFRVVGQNVGTPKQITIGHDNSGAHAGWYLDKATVRVHGTTYTFPCDNWFGKSDGDGKTERDLDAD